MTTFQQWNHRVKIAHHSHLASNAKYYARQGKPVVILAPESAGVISLVIAGDGKDSRILPGIGLITYLAFYRSLRKYRTQLLILNFDEAVNQPDKCIEAINQRFETTFNIREFTREENKRLKEVLSDWDVQQKRAELNSSLPNERKSKLKTAIVPEIINHSLYQKAQAIFDEYVRTGS